jgi:threonine/homoserine/homoserine lactone efflux protein
VNAALEMLAFAGIMAVAQFSPGPDMILLTRTTLCHGGRAGAIMACGIATGLAVHAAIALGGIGYFFTSESFFLPYAKCLASGYLLYLAWKVFVSVQGSVGPSNRSGRNHYLSGLMCNLFNPKAALVLSSICAPFLQGHQGLSRPLALGGIIVVQGAILWTLWAYSLQVPELRRHYDRYQSTINRCFSILLALLALSIWIR